VSARGFDATAEQALAFEALDTALAAGRAAGADAVEAVHRGQESQLLRLGDGRITQAQTIIESRVIVRALCHGAEAYASTTDLSAEGLTACARIAAERAAALPTPRELAELPPPSAAPPAVVNAWDEATAALTTAEKAEWLAPALAAHEKDALALAGRFHTGVRSLGVRSTTGVSAWHAGTYCDLALSTLERPAGHHASSFRARYDLRAQAETVLAMAETTRAECHQAHDPIDIEPGRWDVVLAPTAVADLLDWFGMIGFSTEAFDDGRSFVQGRFGEAVTGPAVTLLDDGTMAHGLGVPLPIDAEGQPRQRTLLLEKGVARGSVWDHKGGRRHGCAPTGHALGVDLFSTGGAGPAHLSFEPGTASLESLLGRLDRGLYITRFHYVNGLIEPKRAVMTGLLRDAAFLVEGGRIRRGVRPIRFTEAILEAFARIPGLDAVGAALEPHGGINSEGKCTVCPALYIPGFAFTSGR
jgi:PmbA protein